MDYLRAYNSKKIFEIRKNNKYNLIMKRISRGINHILIFTVSCRYTF